MGRTVSAHGMEEGRNEGRSEKGKCEGGRVEVWVEVN